MDDELITPEQATDSLEDIQLPSLTYRVIGGHIVGKINEYDAMVQAISKIMQTVRMRWEIYTKEYGHDLEDLIGKEMPYVMSEVERMITEALKGDDRVDGVNFTNVTQIDATTVHINLQVSTLFGKINTESEVEI